jgi:hypothetical protein
MSVDQTENCQRPNCNNLFLRAKGYCSTIRAANRVLLATVFMPNSCPVYFSTLWIEAIFPWNFGWLSKINRCCTPQYKVCQETCGWYSENAWDDDRRSNTAAPNAIISSSETSSCVLTDTQAQAESGPGCLTQSRDDDKNAWNTSHSLPYSIRACY